MSKIIKFAKEEVCHCPICFLLERYTNQIINAENEEELEDILTSLIQHAGDIGREKSYEIGFIDGHKHGYKESIRTDIEIKTELLEDLQEDEMCDYCGKKNCNCECDSAYHEE